MQALAYIVASILFIVGLKQLGAAATARRGNLLSALGMLVAVVATLTGQGFSWTWILLGFAIGGGVGAIAARRVQMTGMPEMVALFNGSGGIASLLVGWASQVTGGGALGPAELVPLYLAVVIGGLTFTGSLVAYGKLSGRIGSKPVLFAGQQIVNIALLLGLAGVGLGFVGQSGGLWNPWLLAAIGLSLVFGVMAVIPIGGADMPVVIALLNAYSGLAACAAGFIIGNTVLIVSGALVGASGIILTGIMCRAMNRSLSNVLFSGFGSASASAGGSSAAQGEARPISAAEAYPILEAASHVVFVPGYGMAVAQAQHAVKELGALLEANGCEVQFAVHPVAGRMPGHMNVLLAEADVAYEQLVEPNDVNPRMAAVDVAIVIGANDVVNPDARSDASSPLYGMPIIDVDLARTCIVLKRSLNPGYAGVENPLFFCANTRMLLGDAKSSVQALVNEFKEA